MVQYDSRLLWRKITYETDKLPALTGLAQEFQLQEPHGCYAVGL